jgi:hypothetical protein
VTSLTLDECPLLLPPFEAAFQAPRAAWRLEGQPRTARQGSVDKPCPLPPPAARLCCLLPYLKTSSLHGAQGRRGGLGQSQATQWLHVLLPVLLAAFRLLGDVPARALSTLAQRLGVAAAAPAPGVLSGVGF